MLKLWEFSIFLQHLARDYHYNVFLIHLATSPTKQYGRHSIWFASHTKQLHLTAKVGSMHSHCLLCFKLGNSWWHHINLKMDGKFILWSIRLVGPSLWSRDGCRFSNPRILASPRPSASCLLESQMLHLNKKHQKRRVKTKKSKTQTNKKKRPCWLTFKMRNCNCYYEYYENCPLVLKMGLGQWEAMQTSTVQQALPAWRTSKTWLNIIWGMPSLHF